ncbi:MAG TPA: type II toxin-antitoxin system RelE/ParE family toxin [Ignavibacteriaceae bacterium]|nr:type II toxin-antitoxin system RelE/ParE family toxin [Ignavibacteriaceae bacterium]
MKLIWTKEALLRLKEIDEYISRDNPVAATDFVDKLILVAETMVDNPKKGRVVPELSLENIRELLYKNYRIVYLVKKSSVEVLTVFEGHQLLKINEVAQKNR